MFEKIAYAWCRAFHRHCHDMLGFCWLCSRGPAGELLIEGQKPGEGITTAELKEIRDRGLRGY